MKKVKITLTIIALSLIIGLVSGCSDGQWSTIPWTEEELKQMEQNNTTEQEKPGGQGTPKKLSPFVRYTW